MLDIGCGPGNMKISCDKLNIKYQGLEGDPNCQQKYIHIIDFSTQKYDNDSIYDLGYSTEFLEHVDEKYINNYINAFKNCKYLLITGAPEHWPGHHHVNCQNHEYWLKVFNDNGFILDPYNTLKVRELSSMNLHRHNKKRFIQHRGLFFINTKFTKVNLINEKPLGIYENKYYAFSKYIEIELPKFDATRVKGSKNILFKSTLPLVSKIV